MGATELDEMFRDLEMRITAEFTEANTKAIWGTELDADPPEQTIKANESAPGFIRADAADARRDGGETPYDSADASVANLSIDDVSVMLSIHSDGSASMSMPGASVTLSPRRTSVKSGAEYEMGEVIGKGGMGVVSLARQASLDRRIVVKTIRPEFAGIAEAQEKFITEALATGSLDHPNVVPIHDMGVAEDGNLFYVMKEVRGRNWREVLSKQSEAENIDILFRVCDAVACAHDKGIIHRDLKPENVMLGDYGEVLVMDWGLAAAISPSAKAAHLAEGAACAGTPSFMAPEMARGMTSELGPWSDQYLLGGILFNILTGRPPHPGKTAQEGVKNAANNVIRASDRKDEWMNVALRAMHAVPAKRYPSVKEFQKALRNCRVHSESIVLAGRGDEYLARAEEEEGHDAYNRAINSYEQALVLWEENAAAKEKLADARYAFARHSLAQGDFALAMSLLAGADGGREREVVLQAKNGLAQREARRRLVKILGAVAAGLLLLVAAVSGVSYVIISRQAEAERQARQEAVRQQGMAERARGVAEERRAEADQQRGIAEQQRNIAEERREEAETQRQRALGALREAEEAREAEARANAYRLEETTARLAAQERARQRAEEALRAREEIQRLGYLEDNSRWRFDAAAARERQEEAARESGLPVERMIPAGDAGIAMRLIPPGSFVMGSPPRDPSRNNDEYLHEVQVTKPFYLSANEVTRGQWRAVVGTEKLADLGMAPGDDGMADVVWRIRPLAEGDADYPATGISYDDIASVFLPALSRLAGGGGQYRLPTEAEWEWAARAGTTGHFYAGDSEKQLDACAWYEANSYGRVQKTGRKEANPWGLHDIIGNVWEINLDAYDSLYYLRAPRNDPVNLDPAEAKKVARGGSYINSPRLCRMSYRSTYMHQRNRYPHAGFRLAWSERMPLPDDAAERRFEAQGSGAAPRGRE